MSAGDRDIYEAIRGAEERGTAAVLATVVAIHGSSPGTLGQKMLVLEGGEQVGTVGGGCVDGEVLAAVPDVLRGGLPRTLTVDLTGREEESPLICGGRCEVFLDPIVSERLVICGGGHVGEALARLAAPFPFSITVLDDRAEFANTERFPGCDTRVAPFPELLERQAPPPGGWVVVVTRAHQFDSLCAAWALRGEPRYVGVIGSRRKTATVKERLLEEGFSEERVGFLRMPIGLEIGAQSVDEIALSILAEIVAVRRLGAEVSRAPRTHGRRGRDE